MSSWWYYTKTQTKTKKPSHYLPKSNFDHCLQRNYILYEFHTSYWKESSSGHLCCDSKPLVCRIAICSTIPLLKRSFAFLYVILNEKVALLEIAVNSRNNGTLLWWSHFERISSWMDALVGKMETAEKSVFLLMNGHIVVSAAFHKYLSAKVFTVHTFHL